MTKVPIPHREPTIQNELQALFARAKMPSSPVLAVRVLELAEDPMATAADFGAVIRTDPALASRLLAMANSAHAAQCNPVTTIERALTVLGLNRVKTISLGFQLVAHLNKLGGAPFDMKAFWQHSLLRACIARALAAKVVPEREEEAFLVGLLQECGVLILVQILESSYAALYRSGLSPVAFYSVEQMSFPHTHIEAISVMAAEWKLPNMITVPLEQHHDRIELDEGATDVDRLTAVSYFTGSLRFADGMTVDANEHSLHDYGARVLGLGETVWAQVQERALREYRDVSTLYSDILAEDIDVAGLLEEANRQLASVACNADQRVVDIEAEQKAIRRDREQLERALSEYRERAALDPLTNVLNRGGLAEVLRRAIEENQDRNTPVGVLFIDLDNFKRLNDLYGHAVGDNVLKAIAGLLAREVSCTGSVGRYGGEEFVVIPRGLGANATRELAERITQQTHELDGNALGFKGRLTCSIGALWCRQVGQTSAEELVATADQLMYKAKRSGKDRCCFEEFNRPAPDGSTDYLAATGPVASVCRSEGSPTVVSGEVRLDQLIAAATRLNQETVDTLVDIRKQNRSRLVLPCRLHYFQEAGLAIQFEQAATRNVSTGGIAVLLARPLARGEAVEIELTKVDSRLFLAGLVSFCRRVEKSIYEVGVQFVTLSVSPIFSADDTSADEQPDWVAQAVQAKRSGSLAPYVTP